MFKRKLQESSDKTDIDVIGNLMLEIKSVNEDFIKSTLIVTKEDNFGASGHIF